MFRGDAVGGEEDSHGFVGVVLCDRNTIALAAALGIERITFPGDHTGFVDDPDGFATRLREVLREI